MKNKYSSLIKQNVIHNYKQGMLIKEIMSKYSLPRSTITDWVYKGEERIDIHNRKYTRSKTEEYEKSLKEKQLVISIYERMLLDYEIPLVDRLTVAESLYKEKVNMHLVCQVLGIERTKFYRYLEKKEKKTWFESETEIITPLIIEIFVESKGRFGPQKIKIKLEEKGSCLCPDGFVAESLYQFIWKGLPYLIQLSPACDFVP